MARTLSNMIPLGAVAPDFSLLDVTSGEQLALLQISQGKPTVVMFICNHCPFVIAIREVLVQVAHEYIQKGVAFAAINSNDVANYPEDSPEKMKELANQFNFQFPYLFDETQEVAKAYQAACTPDFYLFDRQLHCVYRGQFDDSRPNTEVVTTGKDLKQAMDCLLTGKNISPDQKPSLGCNIKWK